MKKSKSFHFNLKTIKLFFVAIAVIASATIDAIQDSIDHKKGARTLYDVWHIAKLLNRAILILIGFLLGRSALSIYLVTIFVVAITVGSYLWDYIYKNHWETFVNLDNTVDIKTGIKFIDKRLGLGKRKDA